MTYEPLAAAVRETSGRSHFAWTRFGASAALVVCGLIALWTWIPPAYDTNDDATIRSVLEGTRIPGQPATGYALLPHSALGWLLVSVREVWPSVYAWDIAVTGTLAWGLAVFASLVWGSAGSVGLRASAIVTTLAVMLPLVGTVQYTISATIAGGAAIALAWTELQRDHARRSVLATACALFVLAVMVRAGGAMAGMLAVVASLLPLALERRRRGIGALSALLAAAVVLFAVLHAVDLALYSMRPEWNAYRELNELVTALFDWNWQAVLPSAVNVTGARSAVGWTANDWLMLEHAWGVDSELFGVQPVRDFYAATVAHLQPWDYVEAAVQRLSIVDAANVSERLNEAWTALLAMAIVVAMYTRRPDLRLMSGMTVCFTLYCVGVQVGFKSLPFRLFAPMIACFVGVVLANIHPVRLAGTSMSVVLVVVLVLCGYQARTVLEGMTANRAHSLQVDAEGAALAALQPSLVVIHRDTFPEEHWLRPLDRPDVRLMMIRLGRNNQNPQLLSFLRSSGLSTFPSAICDHQSVLVINEPGRLEILSTALQERSGRTVAWKSHFTGSFRAWQCVLG